MDLVTLVNRPRPHDERIRLAVVAIARHYIDARFNESSDMVRVFLTHIGAMLPVLVKVHPSTPAICYDWIREHCDCLVEECLVDGAMLARCFITSGEPKPGDILVTSHGISIVTGWNTGCCCRMLMLVQVLKDHCIERGLVWSQDEQGLKVGGVSVRGWVDIEGVPMNTTHRMDVPLGWDNET
jgi:hypothetical protein